MDNYISLAECVNRGLYKINSRNLSLGVFVKETSGFVGIREKFGREYLFTEYHWDTGAPFGTVLVEKFIEMCPIKDLKESHLIEINGQKFWLTNKALFDYLKNKESEFRST